MRPYFFLLVVSCAGSKAAVPVATHDLSNATLPSTMRYQVENIHAVREGDLVSFLDVKPGESVVQLGGNPAELTRAVGENGRVYAAEPPMPPAEARDADLVFVAVDYSALDSRGVSLGWMNQAARAVLKPDGLYAVVDRTPREASVHTDLHALRRAESQHMRNQVEAAGFRFVREGRFLRRDGVDRFVVVFAPQNP
jgi:predicted methyltransferase